MTNTPMTFEEWFDFTFSDPSIGILETDPKATAESAWEYCQAQKASVIAEWEQLKDSHVLHTNLLRGIPAKLSDEHLLHLLGSEHPVNKQAQTIAELVEALQPFADFAKHYPKIKKFGLRPTTGEIYSVQDCEGEHYITVEDLHRALDLIAKVKGK